MVECGTVIQDFQALNGELDIIDKYTELMQVDNPYGSLAVPSMS